MSPGRKEGEVKMVRIGDIVEAHQVSIPIEIHAHPSSFRSGAARVRAGKRSVKSLMLLDRAENSFIMARNTTTSLT